MSTNAFGELNELVGQASRWRNHLRAVLVELDNVKYLSQTCETIDVQTSAKLWNHAVAAEDIIKAMTGD